MKKKDVREVEVVIEAPKGSRAKYKFDEQRRVFKLHKVLPLGASFPFHFGFVPGTKAEDGDPIDVLVLTEVTSAPGCVIPARVVGVLEAEQREGGGKWLRNDRLIAVASADDAYRKVQNARDLGAIVLDDIAHFFVSYNEARDREFKPIGFKGPQAAEKILNQAPKAA